MATLRNLMVRLGIEFDDKGTSRLTRGLDNVASKVARTSSALDKMRLPAFAAGMGAAAGGASAFAVSLVPLAASAAALPVAMAASKAAAGTLKVAMIGVGDAMSAVAEGDSKKLEEALKKLSPNAREFVRASAGFTKSFEPIRKGVQDRLFDNLGGQIKGISGNLLPTATRGMNGLASSMNKGALEAAKFGQSSIAKGALNTVFKATKGVMDQANGAIQPVLKAVARLVILGAPLMQRMAGWAINGAKAGAAFVNSASGAQKLTAWVQRSGDMLRQLLNIGKNLVTGLVNTFAQANTSGTSFLDTIEKLTAKFAAWSKTAAGQQQAANVFKLLQDVLKQIAQILPLVLGPLGALAKLISTLPPDVQSTVTTMIAFGVIAGSLGGKLAVIASVGVKATSALIQFGAGAVRGAAALGNNAGAAARAGAAMRTFGATMLSGIAHTARLTTALSAQAGAALAAGAATAKATIAAKASAAASKIMAAGVWLVNIAMRANPIGIVITAITALIAIIVVAYKKNETFRKIVDAVWNGIKTAIKFAWERVIKPAFEAIRNFIVNTLGPKILWFHNNIVRPTFDKVGKFIGAVVRIVKGHFDFMVKLVTQTIPNAFKNGVAAIGRFWDKVKEIAKKPIAFVVNTVYNNGIARVWNWIADKTGLGRIPLIQGFARGGILPGYSRKDDQLIMARSGEGILVPEAVKALGAGFIHQTNAAARNGGPRNVAKVLGFAGDPGGLGIPGFQEGGVVGWVKGFFAKAKNFFLDGLIKAIKGVTDPLLRLSQNTIAKNGFGSMIHGAVSRIISAVIDKLKSYETELGGGGGIGAVRAARSQLGVPYSWGGGGLGGPSYGIQHGANIRGFDCSGLTEYAWGKASGGKSIGGTTYEQLRRMKRISGPRPGAVGQPHIGHTYIATEKGGLIEAPYTGARVREVGMRHTPTWLWPAFKFDQGGIMEPGMTGVNLTREPEAVFTKRQFEKLGGGDHFDITFQVAPGTNVREFEDAVYRALVNYKKRNRGTKI